MVERFKCVRCGEWFYVFPDDPHESDMCDNCQDEQALWRMQ